MIALINGCTAGDIDKYMANSTDLAKQQTNIILKDNEEQTNTLSEQHKLMTPELAEQLQIVKNEYTVSNMKMQEEINAMHHEISKMGEEVGNILNGALALLGIGGAGGAVALGRKTVKK